MGFSGLQRLTKTHQRWESEQNHLSTIPINTRSCEQHKDQKVRLLFTIKVATLAPSNTLVNYKLE